MNSSRFPVINYDRLSDYGKVSLYLPDEENDFDDTFGSFGKSNRNPSKMSVTQLCNENIQLKPYQCGPAFHLLRNPAQKGIACFYTTGFGKTLTAVSVAVLLSKMNMIENVVVVAPNGLLHNVSDELKTCGSEEALKLISKTKGISYESLQKTSNKSKLHLSPKTLLICDEAHRLRDGLSTLHQKVKDLAKQASYVVLLTGTPYVDSLLNILQLVSFVNPTIVNNMGEKRSVSTIMSHIVNTSKGYVAFPSEQDISEVSLSFASVIQKDIDVILDEKGIRKMYMKIVQLLRKTHKINDWIQRIYTTPKMNAFFNVIKKKSKKTMFPALVFPFGHMMETVELLIKKNPITKLLRIASIVDTQSELQRKKIVEDCNQGKYDIVLVSPDASEGLTFTGIRSSHHLVVDSRPSVFEQQMGRAVRLNAHKHLPVSERVVHVFRYVIKCQQMLEVYSIKSVVIQRWMTEDERLNTMYYKNNIEKCHLLEKLRSVGITHNCNDTKIRKKSFKKRDKHSFQLKF